MKILGFLILFFMQTVQAELNCPPDVRGCLYIPKESEKTLMIYLRGFFENRKPPFPETEKDRNRSIQEALVTYGLKDISEKNKMPILLSSMSLIEFSKAEISKILEDMNLTQVIVASHSGSYKVLNSQMNNTPSLKSVVLLDNFYGDEAMAKTLGEQINNLNLSCFGFYTAHNKARYLERYAKNIRCKLDYGNLAHIDSVKPCLEKYILTSSCLP